MNEETRPVTEWEVSQAMIRYGGSFVQALGRAFAVADSGNQARLRVAFPELWAEYEAMSLAPHHHRQKKETAR
jgi:hypothetical protein